MKLSLKLRLALLSATGMVVLGSIGGAMVWNRTVETGRESIDNLLKLPARRLTERTGWDTRWERFDLSLRLVYGEAFREKLIVRVVGHRMGNPVYFESRNWPEDLVVSHPEDPAIPPPSMNGLFPVREPYLYRTTTFDGRPWRMANLANADLTLHVGLPLDELQKEEGRLAWQIGTLVIAVSLMVFGATWWISRRSLTPVDAIADAAAELTARDLSLRVDVGVGTDDEIHRLITVINGMMDRLEKSFQQAARFSADASHELRTPLTNLYAEVSRLLNEGERSDTERESLASMLEELERLRSVLSGLLLLSKADAGRLEHEKMPVNVAECLRRLCEDYEILAGDQGIKLAWDLPENIRIEGDEILLQQAFHNLLRNAIQHNRSGGFVKVKAWEDDEGFALRVSNSGQPIEGEWRQRIFERFSKAPGQGNSNGYGLGLNLVVEILRAHGGTLSLESSTSEATAFLVRFRVRR